MKGREGSGNEEKNTLRGKGKGERKRTERKREMKGRRKGNGKGREKGKEEGMCQRAIPAFRDHKYGKYGKRRGGALLVS